MQTLQLANRRNTFLIVIAIVVIAMAGAFVLRSRLGGNASTSGNLQVVHLDADHRTYGSSAGLKKDADAVVLGAILDQGVTKNSAATPGIPRTEFSVMVDKASKGAVKKGDTIVVVLTGGITDGRQYEMDGVTWPTQGSTMLMYLQKGADGKYYPLAGGAALGSKKDNSDTFVLPEAVTGAAKATIEVPEADL